MHIAHREVHRESHVERSAPQRPERHEIQHESSHTNTEHQTSRQVVEHHAELRLNTAARTIHNEVQSKEHVSTPHEVDTHARQIEQTAHAISAQGDTVHISKQAAEIVSRVSHEISRGAEHVANHDDRAPQHVEVHQEGQKQGEVQHVSADKQLNREAEHVVNHNDRAPRHATSKQSQQDISSLAVAEQSLPGISKKVSDLQKVVVSDATRDKYLGVYRNSNLQNGSKALHDDIKRQFGEQDTQRLMELKNTHFGYWVPQLHEDHPDRQLVNKVTTWLDDNHGVTKDTVFHKTVTKERLKEIIAGGNHSDTLRGFVARADQMSDLKTKEDYYHKQALNFADSPYGENGKNIGGYVRGTVKREDIHNVKPARGEGINGRVAGYLSSNEYKDPNGGTSLIKNDEPDGWARQEDYVNPAARLDNGAEAFKRDSNRLLARLDNGKWKKINTGAQTVVRVLESPTAKQIEKGIGRLGAAGAAIDLAVSFHEDGNKIGQKTVESGAALAGGWAGAEAGAELGAAVGSLAGPVGTVVGGVVGGVAGSEAGHYVEHHAKEWSKDVKK